MDIRQLRYFVGIADSASILRASERLHVSQSSLSVHLANLESDIGVKLMERTRSGVELTQAGQVFYAEACDILRRYQSMRLNVQSYAQTPSGRVTVGMPSTTSAVVAAELYGRLAVEFPQVCVYITDAGAGNVYEWLLDGRLDLAVMFSMSDDAELDITPLHAEEFCLVSRKDLALPGDAVPFPAIFDMSLVLSSQVTTWRKALDEVADRLGHKFGALVETESVAVIQSILLSGQARAVLPRTYARSQLHGSELVAQRLVSPELQGVVSLVHLASSPLGSAQKAVKEILVSIMQQDRSVDLASSPGSMPVMRTVPTPPARAQNQRKRHQLKLT